MHPDRPEVAAFGGRLCLRWFSLSGLYFSKERGVSQLLKKPARVLGVETVILGAVGSFEGVVERVAETLQSCKPFVSDLLHI